MKNLLYFTVFISFIISCNKKESKTIDIPDTNIDNLIQPKEDISTNIDDAIKNNESINPEIDISKINIIGHWINEKCNLSFHIKTKNEQYFYTYKSREREITDSLNIELINNVTYLTFEGIEWYESLGELGPEHFEEIPDSLIEPKEAIILPIGIEAVYEWKENNFVIQNHGNAMNYYTKLKEGCDKYIYFEMKE